jgi:hypothetical protein
MAIDITECLAACTADLDPRLADASVAAAARRRSSDFSATVCAAYLECRAGADSRQVDLLACSIEPGSPFRDDVGGDGGATLAARIQEARHHKEGPLAGLVPLVWLEYDDVGNPNACAEPSVCVCIEPRYLDSRRPSTSSPDTWHAAVDATDELGMFADSEAGAAGVLDAWIDALPANACPIHVSVMRGRPSAAVKLYLRIDTADAGRYLTRIGWRGRRATLDRVLAWQAERTPTIHLDLTLRDGSPAARLGAAFPCPRRGTRFDRDVLFGVGALALRADELETVWEAGTRWVEGTAGLAAAGEWPWLLHRWVDQKLVIDDDDTELKLYLGCRPLPLLIGAGREAGARTGTRAGTAAC